MIQCKNCYPKGFTFTKYHEGHDAYYCGICLEWLEEACDDENCRYCVSRPELAFDEED